MRIVLDTNVLVSGLISPAGPPGRIVDLVLPGKLFVLHDDRILAEYRKVLAWPRLQIAANEASTILDLIEHDGFLVSAPPLPLTLPNPDDLPFLEVAVAGAASSLITGNERHFIPTKGQHSVAVLNPVKVLSIWLGSAR